MEGQPRGDGKCLSTSESKSFPGSGPIGDPDHVESGMLALIYDTGIIVLVVVVGAVSGAS
jgi:hypothetical protein